MSLKRVSCLWVVSAFVSMQAAMLGASPAAAQSFEGEGGVAVLEGLGLIETEKPDIDIKERGPLVIPASRDLPPPKAVGVTASRSDWPVDADQQRSKNAKVESLFNEQARSGRRLTASEMGGDKVNTPAGGKMTYPESDRARTLLSPSQLSGGHKLMAKQDSWAEKGEPDRRVLSDPPSGYRTPATSSPYVAAPKKGINSWWDNINPFD